jgi:hypothetical protein
MEEIVGVGVFGKFTRHRPHHSQFVSHCADVGEKFADRNAALAVAVEFPQTRQQRSNVVELRRIDFK